MAIEIKKYGPKYRDAVKECMIELHDHLSKVDTMKRVKGRGNFDVEIYFESAEKRLKKNDGIMVVGLDGEKVVGYCAGEIAEIEETDKVAMHDFRDGYLVDLVVMPEYRGQGLGKLFIEFMEKHFKEKGCEAMELECMSSNVDSYAFYKKMGYEDKFVIMMKKILFVAMPVVLMLSVSGCGADEEAYWEEHRAADERAEVSELQGLVGAEAQAWVPFVVQNDSSMAIDFAYYRTYDESASFYIDSGLKDGNELTGESSLTLTVDEGLESQDYFLMDNMSGTEWSFDVPRDAKAIEAVVTDGEPYNVEFLYY